MQKFDNMIALRLQLEKRILQILEYINHPLKSQIEQNLGLFSVKELSQIWEYLETGSLNPIYKFFEDKKQEYLDIINSIKMKEKFKILKDVKVKERLESEKEDIELIEFNF